ncbi:MAG: hypothetical protein PHG66_00605 [Candidatus Colwellbacteria bacterium]|nr:hypothetical protein [Candidatus Colwellbacteria bacterium]
MSLYESSYISDQELEDEQSYEGDEDEQYVDDIKNFPRKCNYNDKTMVMGSKISLRKMDEEERFNSNVTIFIRVHADGTHTVDCFLYSELKHILNNNAPVFLWEGGNFGTALEDFPVYLLPIKDVNDQEIWFEGNYGLLSRYSAFLIYDAKQMKIGSSFSASARHASLEYVWKVRPISKLQYLKGGIISVNESVFTDSLDFSPGNYPGYDVLVIMIDNDVSPNDVCIESQTLVECPVVNFFYRHGGTAIAFATSVDTDEYAIQTRLIYEKTYYEDGSFLFTGKRLVYITGYLDEVLSCNSSLTVEKLDTERVSVTYTRDDQKIWRETIKADSIVEMDVQEPDQEIEDNEEGLMEATLDLEELNTLFEDKDPGDKMTIITMDEYDSEIPVNTTILVYNLPYFHGFKLPSSDKVPDLKKLVVFIKPHNDNTDYSEEILTIPYYELVEYLSVYTSDKYNGLVKFTPPPIEDVENSYLQIVSLTNVTLDLDNDEGLPVGLNVERIFLKHIKNNLPQNSFAPLFHPNLRLDGDEDPSVLYGVYPNLLFLSIDEQTPLPNFTKLCTLFWTGDEESEPSHPNPRVKILRGESSPFKSFKLNVCEEED